MPISSFERRVITEDESWVHHYDPTGKRESMEWTERQPGSLKFKAQASAGKVLLTLFWDASGVVMTDYLQAGHTVTGAYYADLLRRLREAVREKRRGMLTQ